MMQGKAVHGLIPAILLGLLTFVVTGLVAFIIVIVLLPFGINLAEILLAGFWGGPGYALAQAGLFILFILLGNFCTALISWFIHRSRKLAAATFVSALAFQGVVFVILVSGAMKQAQMIKEETIAGENAYTQYATMGDVRIEPQEPFNFSYFLDGEPVEVKMFKKLVFNVPVSVTKAGTYMVEVYYSDNGSSYANSKSSPNVTMALDAGDHVIKVEFVAGKAVNLGYEAPASVQGRAVVDLSYLSSTKEHVGRKEVRF